MFFFFFFSSRRRHTRYWRDWSSDVCSSDLAILQGGDDLALRQASARALVDMSFQGYAVGGLAVGEPQEVMLRVIEAVTPMLPADRPRYLMGVGTPEDLVEA